MIVTMDTSYTCFRCGTVGEYPSVVRECEWETETNVCTNLLCETCMALVDWQEHLAKHTSEKRDSGKALSPLEKARAVRAAAKAAGQTFTRLSPVEKSRANPKSKALAIKAKCYQCQGEDLDPGVRKRIRDCGAKACALWAVRPYQTGDEGESDVSVADVAVVEMEEA